MTVICAYRCPESGAIWIGSDSRISGEGGYVCSETTVKWQRIDGPAIWWVAAAGASRTRQLLLEREYFWSSLKTPHQVATAMRQILKEDGYQAAPGTVAGAVSLGQEIMLANFKGAWHIDGAFGVHEVGEDLMACGSGAVHAEAAAWAVRHHRIGHRPDAHEIVEIAVRAAIRYDNGCGGAIFVVKVE